MTDTLATVDAPAEEIDQAAVDEAAAAARWEQLNPCQVCGVSQHQGPEGAAHVFEHCWKCGYRPGQSVPAGVALSTPGLSSAEIDRRMTELRRGIVQDLLDAMRAGATPAELGVSVIPPEAPLPPSDGA